MINLFFIPQPEHKIMAFDQSDYTHAVPTNFHWDTEHTYDSKNEWKTDEIKMCYWNR